MSGSGSSRKALLKLLEAQNGADLLDDSERTALGEVVVKEYEADLASRVGAGWDRRNDEALRLLNQSREKKTYPFEGCSNVNYPLLLTACLQFASNAYPEIIKGDRVVRVKTHGKDNDGIKQARAERVAEFLSWQHLTKIDGWEEQTDTMLHALPVVGCLFRKRYYDGLRGFCSELIWPKDFVVNYWAQSLKKASRYTQRFDLYPFQIEEHIRQGIYRKFQWDAVGEDTQASEEFLEQYRRHDIDGDGYPEPVVVTVHRATGTVVRIDANFTTDGIRQNQDGSIAGIAPLCYFTKYGMIPSPDGGYYDLGFGHILEPIQAAINSTLNKLLDAGTIANMGGGFFANGLRMPGGQMVVRPNQWNPVDATGPALRDSIVPFPTREPSAVLFSLLGFLVEAGKELASTQANSASDIPANMGESATLALIERGMKVFASIFKRIHRSLGEEYRKQYAMNQYFADDVRPEYEAFVDDEAANFDEDFASDTMDIEPVADPTMTSDVQRMARAEYLRQFVGSPFVPNQEKLHRELFQAGMVPDINSYFEAPEPQQPDPVAMAAADTEIRLKQAQIEKTLAEARKIAEETPLATAKTIDTMASAEEREAGIQMQQYQMQAGMLGAGMNEEEPDDEKAYGASLPGTDDVVEGVPNGAGILPVPS